MEMKEVGTKYWIKAWALEKRNTTDPNKRKAVFSKVEERQALFRPQEISQSLLESIRLGKGIRMAEDVDEVSEDEDLINDGDLPASPSLAQPTSRSGVQEPQIQPIRHSPTADPVRMAQRARLYQPPMAASPNIPPNISSTPSTKRSRSELSNDKIDDLYGATPPPIHRPRLQIVESNSSARKLSRPKPRASEDTLSRDGIDE